MSDKLKDMTVKMGVLEGLLNNPQTRHLLNTIWQMLDNFMYNLLLHDGDASRPDNAKSTSNQRNFFFQYLRAEGGTNAREWKKGDDVSYQGLEYNILQVYAALVWNQYEYEVNYGDLKDLIPILLAEKEAADAAAAAAAAAAATAGSYYYYGGNGEGIGEDLL